MLRQTISMCPTCYLEIPAVIQVVDGAVQMVKTCPIHGESVGVVEVDPSFYKWCLSHPARIYDGHLVDVTTRCNLSCKYCYHSKGGHDIPADMIVNECRVNRGPYVLTGGEPTLRADLPDITRRCSEVGPTYFLTNGTGLLDRSYLRECAAAGGVEPSGFHRIGLSYHAEFDRFGEVIDNLRACSVRPETVFFVIDELDQLPRVKRFAETHRDLFGVVRIKCASNIWNESGAASRIFTSQVLDWFMRQGECRIPPGGKPSYFPFEHNGVVYAVVSWYDVTNVDLLDIACPPTYRAVTGEVTDFVRAMLINQREAMRG